MGNLGLRPRLVPAEAEPPAPHSPAVTHGGSSLSTTPEQHCAGQGGDGTRTNCCQGSLRNTPSPCEQCPGPCGRAQSAVPLEELPRPQEMNLSSVPSQPD